MSEQSTTDSRSYDLVDVLFRHKKKIIFWPLVIIGMAAAIIIWAPRTYQSEARLFLQRGRETVGVDPLATAGQTLSLQQDGRDSEVTSAIEVLKSRGVISQVVDEMGVGYVLNGGPLAGEDGNATLSSVQYASDVLHNAIAVVKDIDPVSTREEAIIQLEKSLVISTERGSTVIVVTLDAESPVGAQAMLDKLIEVYQREHLRIHRNPSSKGFFNEQREILEAQLEAASKKLRDTKNRMGIASIEGRRSTLEGQLREVELAAYQAEQNLATTLARVTDLEKQIAKLPERLIASRKSIPNQGADLLREQLYTLQMRKLELEAKYRSTHPLVVAISAQVEEAEKVVDDQAEKREETTDDVNPIHRELSLELRKQQSLLAGHEARLQTLQEQVDLVHRDLKQLNRNEVELDDLNRDVTIARAKFVKYAESFEQARFDQELENQKISSVSVAQEATFAEKPISPSKGLVGVGALMLAFGSTLVWITASEHFNDRVRSSEDVETMLGLPVLTEVPKSRLHGRVLNY